MIVIYDTLGAYGGSHTLMLRMCQWLSEKNIKSAVICKDDSNTEIVGKMRQSGVKIIRGDLSSEREGAIIIRSLMEEETIKAVCFSWNNYFDIERIKKKYGLKFDNILYCIHPETFKKGIGFKTRFMKNYSKNSYRKIFERMNNNNSIASVDEINIEESERYLGCTLPVKPEIIRLPMYCYAREDFDSIIERGYKSNTILTASRAEYPYKGYVIGLIDDYSVLKDKNQAIKLEIISSGDDYDELEKKISELPDEKKAGIVLHKWMEYEKVKERMRECKVYIGMGTSVFDAALQYKPAIVVKFATYKNFSDHFISEKPEYMAADPRCEEPAIGRLERAMKWSFEEYRDNCIESFIRVKEIYDIDMCMSKILEKSTIRKESILTPFESARHSINHKINEIRFRNRHFARYDELEKE